MKLRKFKTDTWKTKGESFILEVVHWNKESDPTINAWNIYVYFYPKFPGFDGFEDHICFNDLPFDFHGGTTYCYHSHDKNGKVEYKKYGCDYMHLYDDRFEKYSTLEEAYEVERDAEEILQALIRITTPSNEVTP